MQINIERESGIGNYILVKHFEEMDMQGYFDRIVQAVCAT
jgi:hypothetical protein